MTATLHRSTDSDLARRIAESALATEGVATSTAEFHAWYAERCRAQVHEVRRIPFDELRGWGFDPVTGNLGHHTGRFFTVMGLAVHGAAGPVRHWTQPIISQPEIGVLGIAVRDIGGVLHCLMQAKAEPGNVNKVQLSPTVQATRSNYTGAHGGAAVPYLEHFRDVEAGRVLADVLQSEQGSWFYRKRNRNMVVEVGPEVEAGPDFCWLTVGQLHELLRVDNLVNMDARTVLSCLPDAASGAPIGDDIAAAVRRSCDARFGSLHSTTDVLSWITAKHSEIELATTPIPLAEVRGWHRSDLAISHELGMHFSVVAVDVRADSREVGSWTQPLLEPHGVGVIALLVRRIGGVLHALVNARVEPGYLDAVELAPTVQCTPDNYRGLDRPPLLDLVAGRRPEQVLFDAELSEEGGRFHHARGRYLIIEVDDEPAAGRDDFRWLTVHQLTGLLRHSHYLNVEARTLVACLRSLR